MVTTKPVDPVLAIESCYHDREVLWNLQKSDTPKACIAAARELRKLSDALRFNSTDPALRPQLLGLTRSIRVFTTAGQHGSFQADPEYFKTQRRILMEACENRIGKLRAFC